MASETPNPQQIEAVASHLESQPANPATMAAQLEASTLTLDSPLPEPFIRTSRLIIRPMHPQDAESQQRAAAPFSITKYMSLSFPHPYNLEHAEFWVKKCLEEKLPSYAIAEPDHPEIVIGSIGLKPGIDIKAHTAEVGYWIGEPWWGKGYMTEALQGFTDYIFEEKSDVWRRLWAGVFSGNDASMRCLEKCGYEAEGVMKGHVEKHGEVMDLHVFGLTKKDWLEKKSKHQ